MNNSDEAMSASDRLLCSMLIVLRCRREGREAKLRGEWFTACPYKEALERAGWMDGWGKAVENEGRTG